MHDDNRPPMTEQPDHLNRFLDAMVRGQPAPQDGLDSGLAATASHLHGLPESLGTPDTGLKRHVWEDIMSAGARSLHPTLSHRLVSSTALTPASPESAPPIRMLPEAAPRWRGFIGGLATAALVLLVAASAFGLREFAPRFGSNDPTSLPALVAASPSADVADDAVQPLVTECTVEPRDLQETILLLSAPYDDLPPAVVPTPFGSFPMDPISGEGLPEGPPPDAAITAAVAAVFGEYRGCGLTDDPLRTAALRSDDGVLRAYFDRDGNPLIYALVSLGRTPDPTSVRLTYAVGDPSPDTLSRFRMIGPDRVGAFVTAQSRSGYVVFVRIDDKWYIDDLQLYSG